MASGSALGIATRAKSRWTLILSWICRIGAAVILLLQTIHNNVSHLVESDDDFRSDGRADLECCIATLHFPGLR
jgi:cytochrome c-type biogenesis protein CcmE